MFESNLDDGYWDDVLEEQSYYKNQVDPTVIPDEKGREVGEFDVLAVNREDKLALYTEIKSNSSDLSYAEKQVRRAREFFEDTEWTVIGRTLVYGS